MYSMKGAIMHNEFSIDTKVYWLVPLQKNIQNTKALKLH